MPTIGLFRSLHFSLFHFHLSLLRMLIALPYDPTECLICKDPLTSGGLTIKTLECNHSFHVQCVVKWWQLSRGRSKSCPLCRHVHGSPSAVPEPESNSSSGTSTPFSLAGSDSLGTSN